MNRAFSSAPRSDVINVGLCQQIPRFSKLCKAKRFAPAKRLPPSSPSQRRNNKKIQHINDVLYFLVEATGLESTTFWSLRHNRKFFNYFPSISKSFVSATNAFLYSCSHSFHVVQIRKWSNMWSFHLHVKNGCKKLKTTYPCTCLLFFFVVIRVINTLHKDFSIIDFIRQSVLQKSKKFCLHQLHCVSSLQDIPSCRFDSRLHIGINSFLRSNRAKFLSFVHCLRGRGGRYSFLHIFVQSFECVFWHILNRFQRFV